MFPMSYIHRDFVFSDTGHSLQASVTTGENPLFPTDGRSYYEHQISYLSPRDPYVTRFDCGISHKPAGYAIRNRIRPQLVFEFVLAGTLFYHDSPLHAGDLIIVEPYANYTSLAGEDDATLLWCAWEGNSLSQIADSLKQLSSGCVYHLDLGETLLPMFKAVIYNRHYATLDLARYIGGFTDQLLALLSIIERAPAEPSPLVRRALEIINTEYRSITVEALARQLFVAPGYLCRTFHRDMGMPPKQYITRARLSYAIFHLVNTNRPLRHIAESVGYANYTNFYTAFRAQYGISPEAYRRAYAEPKES